MRYSPANPDISTLRGELPVPTDWGFAPEAPTHLPDDVDLELSTGVSQSASSTKKKEAAKAMAKSRSRSDSIVTSAPRPSKREVAPAVRTEPRSARGSQPLPLPQPPIAGTLKAQLVVQPPPAAAPSPVAAPQLDQAPAFMQFANGTAFDPNAVPLAPELAAPIYSWIRRLALQADLVSADRLLRDAIADLTSSLSVVIIYAGPEGFYTLGNDSELPKDQAPILAVGKTRRALMGPHSGLIPISTSSDTIAVIQLIRNARQPAFGPQEQMTIAAIARDCASVLHHLVAQHLEQRHEHAIDQKSLYRPEALQYHRKKGSEGTVADLSPKWTRIAYPLLVGSLLVAFFGSLLLRVHVYSSGAGIVIFNGTPVSAQASGNVDHYFVDPGDYVHAGDAIAQLSSGQQKADFAQAKSEDDNAIRSFLWDETDEQARKSVKTAGIAKTHAQAQLDQRIIRAPVDGTVSDLAFGKGESIQAGQQLATIFEPGSRPLAYAYLPASDRPRIKPDMPLQVAIEGFKKKRAKLHIIDISTEGVGANEIRKSVGQQLADTLKLPNDGATYILVKAKFDSDQIVIGDKNYDLHHGMPIKAEIAIETRPFLADVFPFFEKYLD
ncbi:MAG: HlyD family efflux transporter periplasmic adaptor subunit [Deltaproteobacteria bacterium]